MPGWKTSDATPHLLTASVSVMLHVEVLDYLHLFFFFKLEFFSVQKLSPAAPMDICSERK